ncbi:hypothetical protein QE357_005108 [Siphonobacter sp. BAB-5404]|nr:hypothetical protein [Siphonobacter sp. SORGH_AS_1065]MDR6197996.1 hypothetical protein [Siphonobacter sp. SORGH_AS_0500]
MKSNYPTQRTSRFQQWLIIGLAALIVSLSLFVIYTF